MLPVLAPVLTVPLCNRNLKLDSLPLEDSNRNLMRYSRFCSKLMLENFTEVLTYSNMVTGESGKASPTTICDDYNSANIPLLGGSFELPQTSCSCFEISAVA